MAFRSSGTLEQDIKDIGIKRMGRKEYNKLSDEAKKLLDDYAEELVGALKAFLMRQEFQITDKEGNTVDGGIPTHGVGHQIQIHGLRSMNTLDSMGVKVLNH